MKSKISKFLKNLFIDQDYVSPDSRSLIGKVVILTGDTGEIGSKIKEVLSTNGATVIGASFDSKENGVDITKEDEVKKLISKTYNQFGKIDAVINNAGLFSYDEIENIDEKEFDKVTNVNIKGAFLLAKHVTPIMKKQRNGTIINIGSKISRNTKVEPRKSLYALTKYAVEGFSFALNRELKPFGIRVICLMPGTVNTFFSRKYKEHMSTYDVAEVVRFTLLMDQIDFESVTFKSQKQNI